MMTPEEWKTLRDALDEPFRSKRWEWLIFARPYGKNVSGSTSSEEDAKAAAMKAFTDFLKEAQLVPAEDAR